MKTCFKCSRRLAPEMFYRHKMMADGRLGKCRDCTKRDVRDNRHRRHAFYLEYDRERGKTPERRMTLEASKRRYPEKERARRHLHNATERGKIVKPEKCQECGATGRIDGHHEDYTKPLDVAWLCRPCHTKADAALRARMLERAS